MPFFGLTTRSQPANTAAATPTPTTTVHVAPPPAQLQPLCAPTQQAPIGTTTPAHHHHHHRSTASDSHAIAALASGASPPGTYSPAKGQDYKPHYYPPMPHGCESPSTLPSLLPIRQLECPPPSRSLAEQKGDVTGGTIEGKLCRNITLTRVEIKSSYLVNCTLINCISKGCYFTSTRMIATDIVNAPCVISCLLEDSFISLSILSNCRMIQGAVKESRVMDSDFEAAGVFFCRLTRSSFFQCEYKEIEQVDCELKDCDGNGDVDAFFPLVVPPQQQQIATQQPKVSSVSLNNSVRAPSTASADTNATVNSNNATPHTLKHSGNNNNNTHCQTSNDAALLAPTPNKADMLTRVQSQPALMRTPSTMSTPVSNPNLMGNNTPSSLNNMSPPSVQQRPSPAFVQHSQQNAHSSNSPNQYVQPPSFLNQPLRPVMVPTKTGGGGMMNTPQQHQRNGEEGGIHQQTSASPPKTRSGPLFPAPLFVPNTNNGVNTLTTTNHHTSSGANGGATHHHHHRSNLSSAHASPTHTLPSNNASPLVAANGRQSRGSPADLPPMVMMTSQQQQQQQAQQQQQQQHGGVIGRNDSGMLMNITVASPLQEQQHHNHHARNSANINKVPMAVGGNGEGYSSLYGGAGATTATAFNNFYRQQQQQRQLPSPHPQQLTPSNNAPCGGSGESSSPVGSNNGEGKVNNSRDRRGGVFCCQ